MEVHYFSGISIAFPVSGMDAERADRKSEENIYTSYTVWGEEDKEFVSVFFQFHSGGVNGPALILEEPAKVYLDNYLLMPDSARESGVFYELQIPKEEFSGDHTIRFIDKNNDEYREEFSLTPFELLHDLPDTLKRENLVLRFNGLKEKDVLRVVMMDTSLKAEGVNEMDTVQNNRLDLRKFLTGLVNGPITLHLYKEEERLLSHKPHGTGEISITYALKREFELKD